jgi:hypothetical protein
VAIVMGLDQHRAQITAEWIDTATGELSRSRITPAHRAGVRRFVERLRGLELEVALEATTGWRFVVEELRRVGAVVHLAEPAETSARRGTKKRAKSDRADARHLRELLMVGRLPESWIPPDHLLDLRARVRLRHTLSEQRGEWQQRIQAVLYHHGCPQRRNLMTDDGLRWLAAQPLPACAREQVTVALEFPRVRGHLIAGPSGPAVGCDREQAFLLPPSLDEWLPEDHSARFVIATVDGDGSVGVLCRLSRRRTWPGGARPGDDGRAARLRLRARAAFLAGDRARLFRGPRVPGDLGEPAA